MKVLLVEDEHRIATAVKKGLEQEHMTVDVAYDGIAGYDLASTEPYDVIILDLMLPGKDGLQICKDLREIGNHTPILMLTAKSQLEEKVNGFDTGADDYLTKPFAFEELLARIRALSKRPKTMQSATLTVSDIILDTLSYTVRRGNTEVSLSSKEFALLEFFMRRSGRILSKDTIISSVWEYDADILPNTVEVYIKNLRSKIDQPFPGKKPLITTVRGFGYKFG